jgi:cobalamin biosynthesis protein CobT
MPRKNFPCAQCPARFTLQSSLDEHLNDVHGHAGPSSYPRPSVAEGTSAFRCEYCGRDNIPTANGLRQHQRRNAQCKLLRQINVGKHTAAHLEQVSGNPTGSDISSNPEGERTSDDVDVSGDDVEASADDLGAQIHQEEGEDADEEGTNVQADEAEADFDGESDEEEDQEAERKDDSDAETLSEDEDMVNWGLDPPDDPIDEGRDMSLDEEAREYNQHEQIHLQEVVDQHGHKVYIEEYPCKTAGEAIRPVTEGDHIDGEYPDVGELSQPECFEIAQVLIESGVSGNFRNKFLRLKRVRASQFLHICYH